MLTVQHIAAAFQALTLQGAKPPFDLGDETKAGAAAAIYHRQLHTLSPAQLDAVVLAWGRRPPGHYGARWPTPGDLLAEAQTLTQASPKPRANIDAGHEFRRLLSAAQAARAEALGKTGDEHQETQHRAWIRILAHRFGQAPDGRVLMPRALKAALVELGALEGLLSLRDEFQQDRAQERFVKAYSTAQKVIPLRAEDRAPQLQAPHAPRLLPDHGPEHTEVLAAEERHHQRAGTPRALHHLIGGIGGQGRGQR